MNLTENHLTTHTLVEDQCRRVQVVRLNSTRSTYPNIHCDWYYSEIRVQAKHLTILRSNLLILILFEKCPNQTSEKKCPQSALFIFESDVILHAFWRGYYILAEKWNGKGLATRVKYSVQQPRFISWGNDLGIAVYFRYAVIAFML